MQKSYKYTGIILSVAVAMCSSQVFATNQNKSLTALIISKADKQDAVEEDHDAGINFTQEQMSLAGIEVAAVNPKTHYSTVYAPGEIKANGYASYIVAPRIESIIVKRHATLGEYVEQGQPLITLFSESMAQTKADYLIASTEWQRVKKLGRNIVSESNLFAAKTLYDSTFGKLIAYGLTKQAIDNVVNEDTTLFGQYTLIANRAGVVVNDEFEQGQRVDVGHALMQLSDESELWVEAKVSPNKKLAIVGIDSPAVVHFDNQQYQAKVIQEAHTIDPKTRTRIIRLLVDNQDDSLHAGMFVGVDFLLSTKTDVLAVPEAALVRSSDGDWTVFVEDHPLEFEPVEVELGRKLGDFREIIGLEAGSKVVTKGAFFVASEIAKGGFDPHNH